MIKKLFQSLLSLCRRSLSFGRWLLASLGLAPKAMSTAPATTSAQFDDGPRNSAFWSSLRNLSPKRHFRARVAAKQVRRRESVLDLGCGDMHVESHLPRGCSYQPCDLAPRDDRTIVCDFNAGEMPPARDYDVVMLLGVLEFIQQPSALIAQLPRYRARSWCISYHPSDLFPADEALLKERQRPLMIPEAELLASIEAAGHELAERIDMRGSDILYVTKRREEAVR